MNSPVTLFVIPLLFVLVQSATIPAQDEGAGLQDLSSRLYLTEHPYFQNTIVGATMKKNMKKLCEQCKHSTLCRGKHECEHCAKYCEAYGAETKARMVQEQVGIAREPENDFMRNEGERDSTLVSRFADTEMMSEGMDPDMRPEEQVQMVREPMAEGMDEEMVMEHREAKGDGVLNQKHPVSRYYTVGVIKPGLLMNTMLKLINIKQTNDIEKTVVLVKSKKSVPVTTAMGEEIETEFLKMLGKELETTEKIHGKSPLDSKDINKILETAYEKGELKSKSEAQRVSEADSIPSIHNEKITRIDDKIVSSPNEMFEEHRFEPPAAILYTMLNEAELEQKTEASSIMQAEHKKLRNNDDSDRKMIVSQSLPEEMNLGSSKPEESINNKMDRQDVLIESDAHKNFEAKQNNERENSMETDSNSDESVEENDKARTFHHKKYKKKKKGHFHSYHSYGDNYNQPYGYYRSNDDPSSPTHSQSHPKIDNQGTLEVLTGAQHESLRPQNEDRIGAKDDWQNQKKGFLFKGEGDLLKDLEKSQKPRDNEDQGTLEVLTGAQHESLRPQNEDRIGAKDDWQNQKKGFLFKGEGDLLKDLEKSQKPINNEDLIGSQQVVQTLNKDRINPKDNWQNEQKGYIFKGEGKLLRDLEKYQQTTNDPMDEDYPDERRADDGIPRVHLTEKNKKLDPKKVSIAEPSEDFHDGMPDPFHSSIHTHFGKVQEYFRKQSAKSIVGMTELPNVQNVDTSSDVMIQTRNNEEVSDVTNANQVNIKTDNLQMISNIEAKGETLSEHETTDVKEEPVEDLPKVGINFLPEDLINLQMAKEESMKAEQMDDTPKVGTNVQPQDMIILQKKMENSNINGANTNFDLTQTNMETPKTKAAEPLTNIFATDLNDPKNLISGPQFTGDDENLPGQTVIQVDDQLIDVPDEGLSIFQVNNRPVTAVSNENNNEQKNMFINQPTTGENGFAGLAENLGSTHVIPSGNLRVNPQIMKDQSSQNLGLSANINDVPIVKSENPKVKYPISHIIPLAPSYSFKKEQEFRAPKIVYTGTGDMERSSATGKPKISRAEQELPAPMNKHPFAPAFQGFRAAKIIQTNEEGSERPSAAEELEGMDEISPTESMTNLGDKGTETVGSIQKEYENAIEEKIEKLITPREQEFLHNFGKIVPSIEKMHLNAKSDIYFMGNGIKLPLKMSPNNDGTISLSVDLEKLCKCKNSTCAHKMDIINKLDGNLMNLSNNDNSNKHENDIPYLETQTEKKIRKPRNHIDLSKLYRTYRKKYHKLHRRSVSDEYFRRFKEIEQGLENKLDELNENVKKSNIEYDNMLRKGTKDLLQIKGEDQVVKQRIELVNDLLKWMKEMASEVKNGEDKDKNNII